MLQHGAKVGRIRSSSLVQLAAESIRAAILRGSFAPGDHLVERDLVAQLGVSNIAVREAFAILVESGIVVRIPRRGAWVRTFNEDEIIDLAGVRIALERLVVERAIGHWTDEARVEAQQIVDAMYEAAAAANVDELFELDNAFHRLFWRLSQSPTLREVAARLDDRVAHVKRLAMATTPADGLEELGHLHQRWIDAVSSRDSNAAKAEAEFHITQARDALIEALHLDHPERTTPLRRKR